MNFVYNDQTLENVLSIHTTTRYQCRICLAEVQRQTPHICGCKGALASIHLNCLIEWLKRTATADELSKKTKKCELCREQVVLDIQQTYRCKNMGDIIEQNLYRNYCDIDTKFAILLCIFLLPLVVLIGAAVSYVSSTKQQKILLYLIISMGMISLLGLVCIVRCYWVKVEYELVGVRQKAVSESVWSSAKVSPYFD